MQETRIELITKEVCVGDPTIIGSGEGESLELAKQPEVVI